MVFCHPLSCVCGKRKLPQRILIVLTVHLALQNAFNLRQVLNVTMMEMTHAKRTVDQCPMYKEEVVKKVQGDKFHWDGNQQSAILYVFYIGYSLGHLPGGWLSDKFGCRLVLAGCTVVSSLLNLVFPLIVYIKDPKICFVVALILRFLFGVSQGPFFPATATCLSCWVPPKERSLLGCIAYSGSTLGTIVGNTLTGVIVFHTNEWTYAFFFWSLVSLIGLLLNIMYVYSTPEKHPYITEEEKAFLQEHIPPFQKGKFKVPWLKIFTNMPFWANVISQWGHNYIFFTLVTYLPQYMKDILKMDVQSSALFSSAPFICLLVASIAFGVIGDMVINKGLMSTDMQRKLLGPTSNLLSAALVVVVTYVGCNRTATIFLYMLSMVVKAPYYCTLTVNINDLSLNYGGILFAIVNAFGAWAGAIGIAIVGLLTKESTLEEWSWVFWIMFGVSLVTSLVFWIWGSADRQSWDYPED